MKLENRKLMKGVRDRDRDPCSAKFVRDLTKTGMFLKSVRGAVDYLGGKESTLGGALHDMTEFVSTFETDPELVWENAKTAGFEMWTFYKETWDATTYDNSNAMYKTGKGMFDKAYHKTTTPKVNHPVLVVTFIVVCCYLLVYLVDCLAIGVSKGVSKNALGSDKVGMAILVLSNVLVGSALLWVALPKVFS